MGRQRRVYVWIVAPASKSLSNIRVFTDYFEAYDAAVDGIIEPKFSPIMGAHVAATPAIVKQSFDEGDTESVRILDLLSDNLMGRYDRWIIRSVLE